MSYEALDETALPALPPPDAEAAPPRPPRSCPSGATSWKATPRRPRRSKPSWPGRSLPPAATPRARPGRSCPGSATCCSRTTRSRPTAATSWTSCGTCRPRASIRLQVTADHVKCYKRALLEAGMKSATVARRLSVLRGTYQQLAAKGLVSWETAQDIARRQGPRRPEELDAVLDPAAGHFAPGGDPDRHLAGDPRPGADERLLHHRLPGLGDRAGLRRAPRDRRGRALSPRHREAEQEAAEDPARRRAAGPGLSRARGHRGGQGGAACSGR